MPSSRTQNSASWAASCDSNSITSVSNRVRCNRSAINSRWRAWGTSSVSQRRRNAASIATISSNHFESRPSLSSQFGSCAGSIAFRSKNFCFFAVIASKSKSFSAQRAARRNINAVVIRFNSPDRINSAMNNWCNLGVAELYSISSGTTFSLTALAQYRRVK